MRDACHRHLFNRDDCLPCQRIKREMQPNRLVRGFLALRQALWPSEPWFKDHRPDAWYLKPASDQFQSHSMFLFVLISVAILALCVWSNGGIWAK